jgi:tetratricopeptide (TPR) repeat protein
MTPLAFLFAPLFATLLGDPKTTSPLLSPPAFPKESSVPELPPDAALDAGSRAALSRAAAAFNEGRYEDCLAILESVFPMGSNHPDVLNMRGASLAELGRHADASLYFLRILDQKPSDFWARYNLAECQLLMGQAGAARESFSAIQPVDVRERELVQLKLLLLDLREKQYEHAVGLLPEWPPQSAPGYASYAAMAHYEGNAARAKALLSQAADTFPQEWNLFLKKTLMESGVPVE